MPVSLLLTIYYYYGVWLNLAILSHYAGIVLDQNWIPFIFIACTKWHNSYILCKKEIWIQSYLKGIKPPCFEEKQNYMYTAKDKKEQKKE